MRIVIEYCRDRHPDAALAVVDRVHCEAVSLAAAKSIAIAMAASRMIPPEPDLVRVLDERGIEFFRQGIGPANTSEPARTPVSTDQETER
ncbi:hypothetical protein [Oricola thermophila]|uniref:Uncharacterized protein n=1 Tax=Oricola thermophila TaxID=2742145 RepID=A0A6N1V8U6_9HYPH|nr:hypothetical protein [Oricola thermophila]QKV17370.1 hypothetical protein HTY61_02260 [Oricola thermophila]